jgi:hypothetical protein
MDNENFEIFSDGSDIMMIEENNILEASTRNFLHHSQYKG